MQKEEDKGVSCVENCAQRIKGEKKKRVIAIMMEEGGDWWVMMEAGWLPEEPLAGASTAPRLSTAIAGRVTVGTREGPHTVILETLESLARGISPQARKQLSSTTQDDDVGCFPRAFVALNGQCRSLFTSGFLVPEWKGKNAVLM